MNDPRSKEDVLRNIEDIEKYVLPRYSAHVNGAYFERESYVCPFVLYDVILQDDGKMRHNPLPLGTQEYTNSCLIALSQQK